MKLQAKHRLHAAPSALRSVLKAFAAMTPAQQKTFTDGLWGIYLWYNGTFDGKRASGELKATEIRARADVNMTMNAMSWLSKHFYPETITGFADAYRIHSSKVLKNAKVGDKITVAPIKPILSWTVLRNPRLFGLRLEKNLLIYIQKPKVIFSFKTVQALDKELEKDFDSDESSVAEALTELGVSERNAEAFADALVSLDSEYNYSGKAEKELVVYHGNKPFTAKVVGVYKGAYD